MENTSSETTTASAAETTKAPVRRSRRATAATGETVTAPAAAAPVEASTPESAVEVAVAAPKKRTVRTRTAKAAVAAEQTEAVGAAASSAAAPAEAPATDVTEAAPKKRATRSRKKAEPAAPVESPATPAGSDAKATAAESPSEAAALAPEKVAHDSDTAAAPAATATTPKKRQTRTRKKAAEAEAVAPNAEVDAPAAEPTEAAAAEVTTETVAVAHAGEKPQRTRTRNGQNRRGSAHANAQADNDAKSSAHEATGEPETSTEKADQKPAGTKSDDSKTQESQNRTNRTRQRERKRRGQGDDFEVDLNEDDVLLPIAGILDVLDNYAFVRTSGYLPGTNDVYVSLGQVKKYDLRKGDAVVGAIRQPRENEGNGRQKYNAIVRVDTVNSRAADEANTRPEFATLTAVNPDEVLKLETSATALAGREIDLFAPIGGGQRAVVRGGSASGKTALLREIAAAVSQNSPETHLMYVAIDARPEEITELQRTINGEVIGSSFDRPVEDHTTAAELAIERAKRLVELGHNVVVLLDSVTRLGRAFQQQHQHQNNARAAQGAFDVAQVVPLKRMLAAARNVENGGSLTIISAATLGSVSQNDERILEELESVWNTNIVLSNELARLGDFPAIDLAATTTREAAVLIGDAAVSALAPVRRAVAQQTVVDAAASVRAQLAESANNVEFLALAQRKQGR